jgi:hypothetical protein
MTKVTHQEAYNKLVKFIYGNGTNRERVTSAQLYIEHLDDTGALRTDYDSDNRLEELDEDEDSDYDD